MNTIISVIMPTFGKPSFLENSIQSVIKQTFVDWELIVVDDNDPNSDSRKETEWIMAEKMAKERRLRYVKHERNKNGAVARNTGFAEAKGKYISLLDSDDEYMPERLQCCLDAMKNVSSDVAGVYTGCEFRKSGKKYYTFTDVQSGSFLKETLACTFMLCTGSNIFIRKSVVDELNGFDPTFLRHQDYEFLVRVFEKYSLIGISEILVIKNNENYNLPNIEKQIAVKEHYLGKYRYIIDKMPVEDQNFIYYRKNVDIAEAAMAQNKYRMANNYYSEAQKYGRISIQTWVRRLAYPFYNLLKS